MQTSLGKEIRDLADNDYSELYVLCADMQGRQYVRIKLNPPESIMVVLCSF